jgi:hypothetical protein
MPNALPPTRTTQPTRTAVQLALKDELRTLGANLQHGAQWLLHDVSGSIVKRVDPQNAATDSKLLKLQHLIDSTAQVTLSTLQAAKHAAAITVLPDAAFRTMSFQLQPLAAYFSAAGSAQPSRAFTDVFYWLIRHAIELDEGTGGKLIARQQAVDETYWALLRDHGDLIDRITAPATAPGASHGRDHALLCAALLQALVQAHPVRDAHLPPWAERNPATSGSPALHRMLMTVVVAAGMVRERDQASVDVAQRLQLARQIVLARLPFLETAINQPSPWQALADELAFIFRHA